MSAGPTPALRPIPILVYHSVSADPPSWIQPFAVTPGTFRSHLDRMAELGLGALTVSELVEALAGGRTLPERPVVITIDDGFIDARHEAAPALAERSLPATLYVATGSLEGSPHRSPTRLAQAAMLRWTDLPELERLGIEIGSHSVTHPPLDVIRRPQAEGEITLSKRMLEDFLGHRVRSFAYPHGFYDRHSMAAVANAGYDSAVAVRNALSSSLDDRFSLARLMVRATTSMSTIEAWLSGRGARVAPFPVPFRTRAWRLRRRASELTEGDLEEPNET